MEPSCPNRTTAARHDASRMGDAADAVWRIAWDRLYDARTSLFYDFVSSYDRCRRFEHLPTPEEIRQHYPNPNGWATGMEDSAINGGVMLATACDRFAATGERALYEQADLIFRGLSLCGSLSPIKGFVLRSVSPIDGRSYYPETSRDQVTHFVHGLWRYFHSPLSDDVRRAKIGTLVADLCSLLEHRITRANGYHIGREDGTPGIVDTLWEVAPHEACRLPMVYAAGWDVTGDLRWLNAYRACAAVALSRAAELQPLSYQQAYPLLQHQASLELLSGVDAGNEDERQQYATLMVQTADGIDRFLSALDAYEPRDVATINMNWRDWPARQAFLDSGYGHVPEWPVDFMQKEFLPLRETGEALLMRLMSPTPALSADHAVVMRRALTEPNYELAYSYGMLYPQAAFWRYAANGA